MKTQFWTRKGYLGLLMAFVLAFGVLGNAEALTLTPSISPSNYSTLTEGSTITVSNIRGSLNNARQLEEVTISATGGGTPTFDPALSNWTEEETTSVTDLSDGTGNGTITIPSSVKITIPDAGTVKVKVTWTPKVSTDTSSKEFTFYVVTPPHSVESPNTDFRDTHPTGVHYGYKGVEQQIDGAFTFEPANAPVFYSVQGSGSLYVGASEPRLRLPNGTMTSSSAVVYLKGHTGTSRITAFVPGSEPKTAIYIYNDPSNPARYPRLEITNGEDQTGAPNGRLEEYLEVKVIDSANRGVPGVAVVFASTESSSFIQVPGTMLTTNPAETISVITDSSGLARTYCVTDALDDMVTATLMVGSQSLIQTFTVTVGAATAPASIAIVSGDGQRADADGLIEDPLVVVVKNARRRRLMHSTDNPVIVQFLASDGGQLTPPTTKEPGVVNGTPSKTVVNVQTDSVGEASIRYTPPDAGGRRTVRASINNGAKSVTFTINGAPSSGGGAPDPDPSPPPSRDETPELTISTTGEGTTRSVTVTATNAQGIVVPGLAVTLSGTAVTPSEIVVSGTPKTITLPDTPATYTLQASASGYTVARINLTVAAPPEPGTLSIARVGDRIGGQQAIRVTAQTSGGSAPSSAVLVTLSGATIPPSLTIPGGDGSISLTVTLPSATDAHVLTVSATGYDSDTAIVPAGTGQQTGDPSQPTTGTTGEADSLEIDGSRQLSRNVNQATPLRVRVVDVNSRGVSDVRVTFRILAPGQGRLSQRGNGRAVQVNTDRNGYASASLTPLGGDVIVEAKAAGVSASVTFIIDVSGATTTPTPTPTPSTDAPSSQMINPEDADVHVGAAQRSPILWVDGGAIYALVDADVQRFAPSVENALHITVGGSKVYWTAQTGTSSGTINSANLDGSGVTELKSIMAVPMGIAVDTDARKLYWTNSRGRIQSANLNGSSLTNVLQNLQGIKDIAVARGLVYWTQFDGSTGQGRLGIMNPNAGQNGTRYISTGSDSPMSLTINGNKVYWTEQTGVSSGTINSANLNGSGVKQLASIRAVPSGIGVDMARSHLYWTNSRGRIQRADLDGKQIQNVADGLGSPGDMVLSNSLQSPVAMSPPVVASPPASQYDVNGDGLVNNTDASLVAGAMNTSNAKYDVNGDGTVNFLDLLLVFDNRDAGAASAPTIVGMKLSAVQVDVLQEQINLLIATNDRSPSAMRTLIYLQQLIATARPEQTQLLANYPNPFNPETWIPYELATDTTVRLTIYNTHGAVIRTLQLGHQSAGYYVGRDRAAYWDGRNAFGEQVASGIYFYQLETDAMSLMRKMVILK